MALTINERKERYYNLVLNKAKQLYSLWESERIRSKQVVAKANEYASESQLKTDANYRFNALVFTVALGIRLEKRYGTFFRRLFRIFAYLRERKAFKNLKIVFGIDSDDDIRELMEMESGFIIALLSHLKDKRSTGGGKRLSLVDITLEEDLGSFVEECMQEEEEQKSVEHEVDAEKVEKVDTSTDSFPVQAEETKREKFSVSELENVEQVVNGQKKKPNTSKEVGQPEKQTTEKQEKGLDVKDKIEKTETKSVASTSILAETVVIMQDKTEDTPTPHPVFQQQNEEKGTGEKKTSVTSQEKQGAKTEQEHGERLDKDIRSETERDRSPFPVFREAKAVTAQAPEKVEIKETREMVEIQSLEDRRVYPKMEVSEENKARIALNVTMSAPELHAMVEQIKSAAGMEMERVEEQWRERTSLANGTKQQGNVNPPSANKGAIVPGAKK